MSVRASCPTVRHRRVTSQAVLTGLALILLGFAAVFGAHPVEASHIPFAPGDVFAGVGFGQIKHFAPDGTLLEILDTTTGSFVDTGMCFDAAGNLYTTNFGDDSVSKFNSTGLLLSPTYLTGFDASPESCLFDAAGNLYVGQADGTHHLLKFDAAGNLVATFSPAVEDRGTDWIDLAGDQCTMFYTSSGASIKRFDVCAQTQLPDFCGPCGPDQPAFRTYGLFSPRLHSDGSLLVVDQEIGAIRRFDGSGIQIQSYPVPVPDTYLVPPRGDGTPAAPFTLTLDPDGTSFWTGDVNSGRIFRFDIATGAVLTQFDSLTQDELDNGTVLDLEGLAVFGEFRAAAAPTQGDVSVVKTASSPAINAGDPAQFNIQVTALGPSASSNVILTDTLPAGLSWTVGGTDAAACSPASPVAGGTTLTCSFGTLPQGATRTIAVTAATTNANCGSISNTATVTAPGDANSANNTSGPVTIAVHCSTTVTASITAANKTYDATTAATITGCTLSGVLGTDDVSCATSGASFATASVGTGKPVSATVSLTGAAASHYVLSSSSATTTADITPAPASVTPNPATKTYGATDPTLSGTLSGFLAADNVTAAYSRMAGESVAGSPYTISATLSPSGVLGNYTITYNTASFTITRANASVTPNPASKTYGAADPAFTGTLTGFLAADTVTATYSRTAGETVAGSPYTISATLSPAAALSNYTVTYNTANFTITKANASVSPSPASKIYGSADPAFSGSLAGFRAADGVTATYARTAGETVAGSPYTISATLSPAGVLGNYTITYNTAGFTITAATPGLSLTKAANPTTYAHAGQVIVYTFVVQNTGDVVITGPFTITDDRIGTLQCGTVTSLAVGASISCTASYVVQASDLGTVPSLPTGVTATINTGAWLQGVMSTQDTAISGAGPGVPNAVYPGWCIQDHIPGDLHNQPGTLYSTIGGSLPADVATLPWNKINYVLNHKIRGAGKSNLQFFQDVQTAIWLLLGEPNPDWGRSPEALQMVSDANAHAGFVPGPGDTVAVIIYSDGMGTAPNSIQESIVEMKPFQQITNHATVAGQFGGATVRSNVAQATVSQTTSAPPVDVAAHGDQSTAKTTVTTSTFSTSASNELLLAFVSADHVGGANTTVTSVSGAGLTWQLVVRANTQRGTAEIWRALAASRLTNASVTANLSQSVTSSLTVLALTGVDTSGTNGSGAIGAVKAAHGASGAPKATLTTTRNNSWVFGVGNDWDNAIPRTVGPNQALVHQYMPPVNDTYWVQRTINPLGPSGTVVTLNDVAPTGDRWNLAAVEIRPAP